jgi:hypothetical protein
MGLDRRLGCGRIPRVTQRKPPHPHPPGHVLAAGAAIGAMSLVLAVGLELLGMLARLNDGVAALVSRGGAETFPRSLPAWSIWLATAIFAIGIAGSLFATPGPGRRLLLWLSALVVVAAWAPVLSLAAHAPEIAAPWIATLWSGFCAIFYAARHRMPCDAANDPMP